ncbi:MAG: hypothetical protein L0Y76_07770 [Ignavibacteria bacterium]|nr:hypothetical protein [Ignavibacteria bacterium]
MKTIFLTSLFIFALSGIIYAQVTCNEKDVHEIDSIKQVIETSLINAKDINVKLETKERLQAFYVDTKLVKISVSVDEPYLSAELFFAEGFLRHISADELIDNVFSRRSLYFKDNKLICFQDFQGKDLKDSKKYKQAEEMWLKNVEKYLLAIQ